MACARRAPPGLSHIICSKLASRLAAHTRRQGSAFFFFFFPSFLCLIRLFSSKAWCVSCRHRLPLFAPRLSPPAALRCRRPRFERSASHPKSRRPPHPSPTEAAVAQERAFSQLSLPSALSSLARQPQGAFPLYGTAPRKDRRSFLFGLT